MLVSDQLKYPIGKFIYDKNANLPLCIERLDRLPVELRDIAGNLGDKELNWRYRPEGWKLYQVVHHLSDSHINAYVRMKIAFTESGKSITAYNENAWSELIDVQNTDLEDSLTLIALIHKRLVKFLNSLTADDWQRTYYHAEDKVAVSLHQAVQQYAWHGDHHLAHLRQGLAAKGTY